MARRPVVGGLVRRESLAWFVTMKPILAVSVAAMLACAAPASAIIMRHDVDQSRYLLLGHEHRAGLALLAAPSRDGSPLLFNGMGTLIAPDWVLTAGHAVDALQAQEGSARYVYVKGRGYRVAEVIVHPEFSLANISNDIALIRLEQPVRNPAPVCLYEADDEMGEVVVLVGAGVQGDGLNGPSQDPDGALRGATTTISGVRADQIEWVFRGPEQGATPLEGISGPGDSGGAALLERGGRFCIAGISSYQRSGAGAANPGAPFVADEPPLEGHYGVVEVYTRVSHFVPWIRATMGAATR